MHSLLTRKTKAASAQKNFKEPNSTKGVRADTLALTFSKRAFTILGEGSYKEHKSEFIFVTDSGQYLFDGLRASGQLLSSQYNHIEQRRRVLKDRVC